MTQKRKKREKKRQRVRVNRSGPACWWVFLFDLINVLCDEKGPPIPNKITKKNESKALRKVLFLIRQSNVTFRKFCFFLMEPFRGHIPDPHSRVQEEKTQCANQCSNTRKLHAAGGSHRALIPRSMSVVPRELNTGCAQ